MDGISNIDVKDIQRPRMLKLIIQSEESKTEGIFDEVVLRMQGIICASALPPLVLSEQDMM